MGNLFEAMGRAQPVSAIQNFQSNKANIASQKNQLAVQNLQMENVQQQMDIRQNNFDTQLAKEKEGMTPVSTDQFTSSFYGGPDGAVAKWALKRGIDMGIINTISEGVTTITPDNAKKFRETLSKSPGMLSELNLVRINATKLAKDTAYDAWQKKPDDQTKAEYDKAMMEHNAAIGASSNLENYFKNQPKEADSPTTGDFERDFLDKSVAEYSKTMSAPDAMKKALSDLEATKKAGKFEPQGININLGDKIQQQETAKDKAFWTGTKAREEAKSIAKDDAGDGWEDMTAEEKNLAVKIILNDKITSVSPDAVFGEDNGVIGWYVPDKSGKMVIIQRWSE